MFVEPAYGRRALADVVPAVATALGAPLGGGSSSLVLPEASAYVVFLVDGLGAEQLRRYGYAAPFLAELSELPEGQEPATAGVPSTTAASLTSFGTGLGPGRHGLVGFTNRVPGTDLLHNNLWWDDDVDPLEWQPHPTAWDALTAAGVSVAAVNKRDFATSGMTRASLRGARFVGADLAGERIAAALDAVRTRPSLTYLYDSDLDGTGHKWGVASTQWLQQLSMVDAEIEQLREALPDDVRLVVVADHGMVDCPPERRIDVDAHSDLLRGVELIGGEARFRHVYTRGGAVDDVAAAWRERLGVAAEVLTRTEAVARGWFGPVDDAVAPRIGDLVVACRDSWGIFSSERFGYEMRLVGLHGSLTAEEMLIPLLVC